MLAGAGSMPALVKNVKFKMRDCLEKQPAEKENDFWAWVFARSSSLDDKTHRAADIKDQSPQTQAQAFEKKDFPVT
jgi:hypothetical protein